MQKEGSGKGDRADPDVAAARQCERKRKAAEIDSAHEGEEYGGDAEIDGGVAQPTPFAHHDARQQPPERHPDGGERAGKRQR